MAVLKTPLSLHHSVGHPARHLLLHHSVGVHHSDVHLAHLFHPIVDVVVVDVVVGELFRPFIFFRTHARLNDDGSRRQQDNQKFDSENRGQTVQPLEYVDASQTPVSQQESGSKYRPVDLDSNNFF